MKTRKLASLSGIAIGVTAVVWMAAHHITTSQSAPHVRTSRAAVEVGTTDIVKAIQSAGVSITDLSVQNIGGIVLIQGRGSAADAQQAASIVKSLGYSRVANLVQAADKIDDEGMRREAERRLAMDPSLGGCALRVHCDHGVLSIDGTVTNPAQEDLARVLVSGMRGPIAIRFNVTRAVQIASRSAV